MSNSGIKESLFNWQRGTLFVVSGPSGVGKNRIIEDTLKVNPQLKFVRSLTTRPMRLDESPGNPYHFVPWQDFIGKIRSGEMMEWQMINGHIYGSSKKSIEVDLAAGIDLITDMDVLGAHAAWLKLPTDVCIIFVIPPSRDELMRRIVERETKAPSDLDQRMRRAEFECSMIGIFDYAIRNEDLITAVHDLSSIVNAHRCRRAILENLIQLGYQIPVRTIRFIAESSPSSPAASTTGASCLIEFPKTRLGLGETKESALNRLIAMLSLRTSVDLQGTPFSITLCDEHKILHEDTVHFVEYMQVCRFNTNSTSSDQHLLKAMETIAEINARQFKSGLCF